jgi:hypothetical protein
MEEFWIGVKGYKGKYQVSTLGCVKSMARTIKLKPGWCGPDRRVINEKVLSPAFAGKGYAFVGLCKNGRVSLKYVHRLVWESFNGPIKKDMEINHRDGNKRNNSLDNLEAVSHRENMLHAHRNGLTTILNKGEGNPSAILTDDKVIEIKRRLALGEVQRRIAEDIGVSYQTITLIKQGKTWSHVR